MFCITRPCLDGAAKLTLANTIFVASMLQFIRNCESLPCRPEPQEKSVSQHEDIQVFLHHTPLTGQRRQTDHGKSDSFLQVAPARQTYETQQTHRKAHSFERVAPARRTQETPQAHIQTHLFTRVAPARRTQQSPQAHIQAHLFKRVAPARRTQETPQAHIRAHVFKRVAPARQRRNHPKHIFK